MSEQISVAFSDKSLTKNHEYVWFSLNNNNNIRVENKFVSITQANCTFSRFPLLFKVYTEQKKIGSHKANHVKTY